MEKGSKHPNTEKKWDEHFLVEAYLLAKEGCSNEGLASSFGVALTTVRYWLRSKPAFKAAVEKGRSNRKEIRDSGRNEFQNYVFQRLPEELQDLWDEIETLGDESSSVEWINNMLEDKGENTRKHLFLHALTTSCFNTSYAMTKIGVTRRMLRRWMREDEVFKELTEEVHWHKKNFFESGLMNLVASGNAHAIIFVNKCMNKDRGYSDEIDVNINDKTAVTLKDVPLSIETKVQLLEAIRAKKEQEAMNIETETEDEFDLEDILK